MQITLYIVFLKIKFYCICDLKYGRFLGYVKKMTTITKKKDNILTVQKLLVYVVQNKN